MHSVPERISLPVPPSSSLRTKYQGQTVLRSDWKRKSEVRIQIMTTLPQRIAAIRTRGRRIFHIIFASVPPSPRLASIFRISGKEICTFPVLIFKTVTIKNAAVNTENTRIYLERRLKISFLINRSGRILPIRFLIISVCHVIFLL